MSNGAPQRADRIRFTRTDDCGIPVAEATPNSRITFSAFVSVSLAADVFTSTDIEVVGASGAVCQFSKGVSSLRGFDVTIQLCNYNEAVTEITGLTSTLSDYTTPVEDVGGVITASGAFNSASTMVEWWPRNGNNDACAVGGTNPTRPFLHYVLPRVNRWVVSGNQDFGDSATLLTLQGYAEPTRAFAASRAADEWTVNDLNSINQDGVMAWREVTALPVENTQAGYDA